MFWVLNKKRKVLYLCGHYSGRYIDNDEEKTITVSDCDSEYPKLGYDLYKDLLYINPLEGYKFMINKEAYDLHFFPKYFPCIKSYDGLKLVVMNDDETGITEERFHSQSSSEFVSFMEVIFQALGYETVCRSLKYRETEEYMKEMGYEPSYYYGGGCGCCQFVKKK